MACKRKSLCIDEKVLLIRAIEAGDKISTVGRRFGFSRSTVATIWKNRTKILQAEEDGISCKKLKKPKYEVLDQATISWFNIQRQNNMPISGPIVKAKAEKFAEELGLTNFKSSEGWLGKFKQRHHINFSAHLPTYIEVDCLLTTASPTDKEILDSVRKPEDRQQGDNEADKNELDPPPSSMEALEAAKLLEKYFLYHQEVSLSQDMNKISQRIEQTLIQEKTLDENHTVCGVEMK